MHSGHQISKFSKFVKLKHFGGILVTKFQNVLLFEQKMSYICPIFCQYSPILSYIATLLLESLFILYTYNVHFSCKFCSTIGFDRFAWSYMNPSLFILYTYNIHFSCKFCSTIGFDHFAWSYMNFLELSHYFSDILHDIKGPQTLKNESPNSV